MNEFRLSVLILKLRNFIENKVERALGRNEIIFFGPPCRKESSFPSKEEK